MKLIHALALAGLAATAASAHSPYAGRDGFVTLGTGAGPTPQAERAQPANLLLAGDRYILVDAGDGAAQQLGKIGVPMEKVQTIFISHLHFDHTGGLFAFLARRFQIIAPGAVTIYGPPGTRSTVDAMIAAMKPGTTAAANIRARSPAPPEATVKVVELHDGWTGAIGVVKVTVASNSHYVLQPDTPGNSKKDTYAFRFDMPHRSIVYTGDTGPSAAVETLAKGADTMFAEIMDPDASLATIRRTRPDVSAQALAAVEAHYRRQHLSPDDVGRMAARAGVKALVLTHNAIADDALAVARMAIAARYKGPITFAKDLDAF